MIISRIGHDYYDVSYINGWYGGEKWTPASYHKLDLMAITRRKIEL